MLNQDLLEILRCPACVSGPDRKEGDDPGQLALVGAGWLVCQEPDCGRKYPIVDEIPRMLVEIGDKYAGVAVEDLGEPEE
ncbi:MAG: hypothetical protein PVF47_06660 [Anaerolineae bacterium]|jgi:hypothetical protein